MTEILHPCGCVERSDGWVACANHIMDGGKQMNRVDIYSSGPLTLSVCAPKEMTIKEVLVDVERQHPCGTTTGWQLSTEEWLRWDPAANEKVGTGRTGPIPCDADDRKTHWLLTA